jgi:hypothetical protein
VLLWVGTGRSGSGGGDFIDVEGDRGQDAVGGAVAVAPVNAAARRKRQAVEGLVAPVWPSPLKQKTCSAQWVTMAGRKVTCSRRRVRPSYATAVVAGLAAMIFPHCRIGLFICGESRQMFLMIFVLMIRPFWSY